MTQTIPFTSINSSIKAIIFKMIVIYIIGFSILWLILTPLRPDAITTHITEVVWFYIVMALVSATAIGVKQVIESITTIPNKYISFITIIQQTILFLGFSFATIIIFSIPINSIFPKLIPSLLEDNLSIISDQTQFPILYMMLAFLSFNILAPIAEELLFRGVLLSKLSSYYSQKSAIIITSLAFAILHIDLIGGFVFALAAAYMTIITRSLKTAVLFHISTNIFIDLIDQIFPTQIDTANIDQYLIDQLPIAIILAGITTPLIIRWFIKQPIKLK